MKKFLLVLSFALFIYPGFAVAAGFAKDPLFLSRSPVIAGQKVLIYAIVANDDISAFSGSVVLSDGTQKIASVPVSISTGGTQTASAPWMPDAGTHTIQADLISDTDTIVEQESASFAIAAPPTPTSDASSASQSAAVDSSAPIQTDIANISPQVASASQPLFTVIDSARESAAGVLDNQIAATKAKISNTPQPGIVLGSSTIANPTITNPWGMFWFALYTIYLYMLTVLRWLIGNAGVFYPVLAIFFFYMLWRIYKRMSRPRY
ncbi:MAG: Ig-like domain-containing protein [Minisyncoccia bacterium]|jgi:hypothetical protein